MERHMDLMQEPEIPPESFFPLIDSGMNGLRTIALLLAAVELKVFEHLKEPTSTPALSRAIGIDPSLAGPLCNALISLGLIRRTGRRYRNTPLSDTYLTGDSPFSQVNYIRKNARMAEDIWLQLPAILRNGPVSYESGEFFSAITLRAMAENACCGRLQATIRAITEIPRFRRFRRMIDLGGGHGLYAIALAQQNPGLEAYVMDLPSVIPLTEEYISRYHADRVHTIPGNFFKVSFGRAYDIIFSSSNPSGKSIEMIPKMASALNRWGVFVNVQSEEDERRDSLLELEWHLWTLNGRSKGKDHYTREQPFLPPPYRDALRENDLYIIRLVDIVDNYHKNTTVKMMIAEKRGL